MQREFSEKDMQCVMGQFMRIYRDVQRMAYLVGIEGQPSRTLEETAAHFSVGEEEIKRSVARILRHCCISLGRDRRLVDVVP